MQINYMDLLDTLDDARILATTERDNLRNKHEYVDSCIFQAIMESLQTNMHIVEQYADYLIESEDKDAYSR